MSITILDCETTISNKGNPFDSTNKLCAVGLRNLDFHHALKIEYGDEPYGSQLTLINRTLSEDTDLLVGFNLKFDLNWLYRYGIVYHGKVWDCQLFEHFASNMTWIYPSLEESCQRRNLEGQKYKDIEAYWDQKIDTTQIPWELIEKRVLSDISITEQLYLAQLEVFSTWPRNRQNLFKLQCQDLLVLHHIERNGFHYDEEKSKEETKTAQAVLLDLQNQIHDLMDDHRPNLNSDEHLSAVLYGGKITYAIQQPNGVYKSGAKKGQTRYSWVEETVEYPRLVEPLEGTAAEKEGVWSVDKKVLGRLLNAKPKARVRDLLTLLLKFSAEARSISSYLDGLPKLIKKMNWPANMLHGTINQVVVKTGRTSSSKPNLQNFDGDLKHLFTSRFS